MGKHKITFRFSPNIDFMAWYDKTYYRVSVGVLAISEDIQVPEVTKGLLYRQYLAEGKNV
jgi:hypothetical protein